VNGAASPPVRITITDGLAEIVLDNPAGSNRFDLSAAEAFDSAVNLAADPSVRCVVVIAARPGFCVGGDLTAFDDTDGAVADLHRSALRTELVLRALGDLANRSSSVSTGRWPEPACRSSSTPTLS
jgi:enoyl-CoA hydratase/carnithine racemase